MMNETHAPSGTLAGLLALTAARLVTVVPDTPITLGWLAGCTAGALLPDTDHPSSTPSRIWGPLTSKPAGWLGRAAGGHRAATHDVSKGAPALFGLAFTAGLVAPGAYELAGQPHGLGIASRVASMTVVALLAGLTLSGLHRHIGRWAKSGPGNFAASWAIGWAITTMYPTGLPWTVALAIGVGVTLGVLAGIAGDGCTLSGIPWRGRTLHLLPRSWRVRTNSAAEVRYVRAPILVGCAVLALPVFVSY